jgi:hypothetical protein
MFNLREQILIFKQFPKFLTLFKFSKKEFPQIHVQALTLQEFTDVSITLLIRIHLLDPTSLSILFFCLTNVGTNSEKFSFGAMFAKNFGFTNLQIISIAQTDLAGLSKKHHIDPNKSIEVKAFDILTFSIEISTNK